MTVKNYKELIVWQKSMTAVTLLYSLIKKLPKESALEKTLLSSK